MSLRLETISSIVAFALFSLIACAPSAATALTPAAPRLGPTAELESAASRATTALAPALPANGSAPDPRAPKGIYTFGVSPQQSEAMFAVHEVLLGQPRLTVGRTQTVEGEFSGRLLSGKPVFEACRLRVDLRAMQTDNGMRDFALRERWLESNKYPFAEFVAKEVLDFPDNAAEGKEARFKVAGDMTIRQITRRAVFDVSATFQGDTLTGTGTTFLLMKDYGFDPPEILGRFKVSDGVTVTVKGVAKLVTALP